MRDFINIGPTPPDEKCQQLGTPTYDDQKAREECHRYADLLRKHFGPEPMGARLQVKGFSHDFGFYHEVVCWYDEDIPDSVTYAFKCEGEGPATWED